MIMLNSLKLAADCNEDQMKALRAAVETKDDLFITGGAGTGKSFLIYRIKRIKEEMGENVALCAPTGVAANNISGVTIHRLFSLTIEPHIDKNPVPPSVLRVVDTVIIDEISMVRCDIFEHVRRAVIAAEIKWNKQIQIIVVGDFFQLPPILKENEHGGRGEKDVLIQHYGTKELGKLYAFQSTLWNFHYVELTQVMRQENQDFTRALNLLRKGDPFGLPWIDAHSSSHVIEGAPYGVPSNSAAKEINDRELEKLNEETENVFTLRWEGDVNDDDIKPFDRTVRIRDGALVMILINDDQPKPRYVNGSIARVISSTDHSVTVKILKNGEIVTFWKIQKPVQEYSINQHGRLDITVVGTFTQIPLKICYAMTIHKMQGLSFDALNLTPAVWEDGLLYTGVTRVKAVENLYYPGKLSDLPISCNKEVEEFYSDPEGYRYPWPQPFGKDYQNPTV